MTRLDHNRAMSQLAAKTGAAVADIKRVTIWGNHSATQYPDINHATVAGKSAIELVDQAWVAERIHPAGAEARRRGHRGARALQRRVRGLRGIEPHAGLGGRHAAWRLGEHGGAERR